MAESVKEAQALAYFNLGYNCAQSVFAAFHTEMGLNEAQALRLASSMGGGVGGQREVCGAFLGLSMVLGALLGYDTPDDMEAKKAHYARIQALGDAFRLENGTLICRELLECHGVAPSPTPADRSAAYYRDRPCAKYVAECARMAEERLAQENA